MEQSLKRIFFLVNNNFHLIDVRSHLSDLKLAEVHLICIPHTLDRIGTIAGVKEIHYFDSPFIGSGSIFNVVKVRQREKEISASLQFSPSDTLLIYTEYEPLNHYVACLMKKNGGSVYVLDEGLGTYLTFSQDSDLRMPLKQTFKLLWSRYVLHYSMKYLYLNQMIFPQMRDELFDGLLTYRNFNCVRDIPLVRIKKPDVKKLDLDNDTCIFINGDIYNFYTSWSSYIEELVEIMEQLCVNFKNVYFKFHPREPQDIRDKIAAVLSVYDNLTVLQGTGPVEMCIEQLRAGYAVSYVSTSLLNLASYGVQIAYIFQLMPSTSNSDLSVSLASVFRSLGIRLVEHLRDIVPGQLYSPKDDCEEPLMLSQALGL